MSIELVIAGAGGLVLAAGHVTVGLQVLPNLTRTGLPPTRFGPSSMTVGMLRFAWNVVTLVLLTISGILISLAWAADVNPRIVVLRWFAALFLALTALGVWNARRRLSSIARPPVPLVSLLIAAMCLKASI